MQLKQVNNQPIEFTRGDVVTLNLIALDDSGNPVDLTAATFATQILAANGFGVITFPNNQHTPADQSTNRGEFSLALSASDTASCGEGASKQIITEATVSANPTYYRGINLLTVYPNVPLQ